MQRIAVNLLPKRGNATPLALLVLLLAGFAGFLPLRVSGGATGKIDCGQVIRSVLDSSDTVFDDGTWLEAYEFRLDGPSTVSVLMTSEEFAPYVFITDESLRVLHEGEPPRTELLAAGSYTVFANNYAVLPAGSYPFELSMSCSDDGVETIRCGDIVAGQLEPSDDGFQLFTWRDPFDFSVERPTRVRFAIEHHAFDAVVILRSDNGNDLGSSFDEIAVDLEPGDYTAFVNNFTSLPNGAYPYRFSMTCSGGACHGDCDGDRVVSIAEIVLGVRIALGLSASPCSGLDLDGNGGVSVSELVSAVRAALRGCAGR